MLRRRYSKNPDGINTGNPLENTYCPFAAGRLRELYSEEGRSYSEIAVLAHSNRGTVRDWVRLISARQDDGGAPAAIQGKPKNPDGINTGNPLQNTQCPFSAERLRDLYCKFGKSRAAIGELLNVHGSVVGYWLRLIGVAIRTRSEANVRSYHNNQKRRDINRAVMLGVVAKRDGATCSSEQLAKARRKGIRVAAQNRRSMRITRPCTLCGNSITRKPSRMRTVNVFCDAECRTVFTAALLHARSLDRKIEVLKGTGFTLALERNRELAGHLGIG